MHVDTTFIKDKQHMHSQVSTRTQSNQQFKHRFTKQKFHKPLPVTTEQSYITYTLSLLLMMN